MRATLGIDIGTFESKGVIVDSAGNIIAQAARAHKMQVPRPGWAEHDAMQDWWGDFVYLTKNLLAQSRIDPKVIGAVAVSAIGPCMLPVDETGEALTNGVLYGVDTRAHKEILDLNDSLEPDVILAHGGNALTSQSVGPKILWLQRNRPDIWEKTHKILTSTSFIVHRLTGKYVMDHYTAASFGPLYDIKKQTWDDIAGVCPLEKLPKLMWSTDIVGPITESAAQETGLSLDTVVTCGTIDAASEAISVGVRSAGDMMVMYGSTIFIIALVDQQIAEPSLWHAPWLYEGTFAMMAGLATSGTLTHWFRDELAQDLDKSTAFEKLAQEAALSPLGAKGLICLPHFSGERTPIHNPNAKGAYFGLNLTHNRADIYRATIEGIAYATRHITDVFTKVNAKPKRVIAVGGGTKNEIWLQATSDVTGLDQDLHQISTGASYGNAFLAATALGWANPEDISTWNPASHKVSARISQRYDQQYQIYRKLYEQTKNLAKDLDFK